jgi:hypothetical protein
MEVKAMRRKGLGTVAVGAVLMIAAVAGFVIVPEHTPGTAIVSVPPNGPRVCGSGGNQPCGDATTAIVATGLSRTAYDVARIATWALVIVGALVVAMGLTRYGRPRVALGGAVMALAVVAGVGFVAVALHEFTYASNHPYAYGPANVIAWGGCAGAVLCAAVVLVGYALTRHADGR